MSDIVERLRLGPPYDIEEGIALLEEAATEIEGLRCNNQELRKTIEKSIDAIRALMSEHLDRIKTANRKEAE